MTDNKHTPGPWKIVRRMGWDFQGVTEQPDEHNKMGFAGPSGERICWFGNSENYYPTEGDEPSEADAHLIAAAPDLLAALKTFVAEYVELVESGDAGFWNAEEEAKVIAARAAIAKAEGSSAA